MKKNRLLFVFLISVFTFTLTNNVFAEETYDPETKIRALNTIGTSIADDDPDHNLRFIGANPNNYVSFNGQKWRIIGVFDGRLKIIEDPIGNYSWDTSKNDVNNGFGVNQWGASGTYTGADLMKLLNPRYESNQDLKCNTSVEYDNGVLNCGDNTQSNYTSGLVNNSLWWNGKNGKCYTEGNYGTSDCDFRTTGLQSDEARNMIDDATWYLGSNVNDGNIWDGRITASVLYNWERSNNSSKKCAKDNRYCSDTVDRTTTWQGKVGLLYPSDYAYATGGGSTYNRSQCLSYTVGDVNVYTVEGFINNWYNTYTDCKNNDWLLPSDLTCSTWSLSPRANSFDSFYVFSVHSAGYVYGGYAESSAASVRPVVFLKSSVQFTGDGNGTQSKPFELKDVPKDETNTSEAGSATEEKNVSESSGTISNTKQVVKTGNTGITQSSLLIIIGSIMIISGSIVIFKKRKN